MSTEDNADVDRPIQSFMFALKTISSSYTKY